MILNDKQIKKLVEKQQIKIAELNSKLDTILDQLKKQ